jgi:hypothetical protein
LVADNDRGKSELSQSTIAFQYFICYVRNKSPRGSNHPFSEEKKQYGPYFIPPQDRAEVRAFYLIGANV